MFRRESSPFTFAIRCLSLGSIRVLLTVATATFVAAVIIVLTGRPAAPPIGCQAIVTGMSVFRPNDYHPLQYSKGCRDVWDVGLEGWFLG